VATESTPEAGAQVLLAWSSGKDSAWALHVLRRQAVEVVGLLTTFNEAFDRVAMHSTRREIAEAQAEAAGLPLWSVMLPWPCSNEQYEERMAVAMARAESEGVTHVAFGDLFLEGIRDYRIEKLAQTRLQPLFPIWTSADHTAELAQEMLAAGLRARVTCVDPRKLDASFVGREYDAQFLADLPPGVDPCGENGEFHTVCYAGPAFAHDIALEPGEIVERDGFWFAEFTLAG
jgi:uncharacterized protein (TIGR00290 family)